jgi:hypothetical protein
MKLKSKILFLTVALGAICVAPAVKADVTTNTIPFGSGIDATNLTQVNFFQALASWGTTRYASGLTWPTNDLDMEVGSDYASQTQWANYVAVTKNINSFYVGAQMNNSGIAGTIQKLGGRAGYTLSNSGDLRLKAGLYGGYQLHDDGETRKGGIIQPEFGGEKLLTGPTLQSPTSPTTFLSAWIYYPIQFHGQPAGTPGFKIAAGSTF